MLLVSRFLFGFGGSKVVHRKYIANFVQKQFWTKYYSRLVFFTFFGMCFGPLAYLLAVYVNINYEFNEQSFVLPGYIGLYLSIALSIVLILFFRRFHKK